VGPNNVVGPRDGKYFDEALTVVDELNGALDGTNLVLELLNVVYSSQRIKSIP
jgi:hypothetical protein